MAPPPERQGSACSASSKCVARVSKVASAARASGSTTADRTSVPANTRIASSDAHKVSTMISTSPPSGRRSTSAPRWPSSRRSAGSTARSKWARYASAPAGGARADHERATGGDVLAAREVRIGVAHALTEVTLTEPVDRVRRAFPRLALSLTTGWSRDLLERVRARALDGAIVLLSEPERPPAGLAATRLGPERLVVIGPRGGRAASPRVAGLGEVGSILNPEGCAARALLQRAPLPPHLPMRVTVETYTYELQLALVARGRGLGLVPARILARSPLRSRLRVRRMPGLDFPLTIWAVRARATPELELVWDALDRAMIERLGGAPLSPRSPSSSRAIAPSRTSRRTAPRHSAGGRPAR